MLPPAAAAFVFGECVVMGVGVGVAVGDAMDGPCEDEREEEEGEDGPGDGLEAQVFGDLGEVKEPRTPPASPVA